MSRAVGLAVVAIALLIAGCAAFQPPPNEPPPPPPLDEARAHLERVIQAGLARDWNGLCALASGTCEQELRGNESLAPKQAPDVAEFEVLEPIGNADGWSSGGVRFTLCGTDGAGNPYESQVLVFDDGERLLAAAAVYWTGTGVSFAPPGNGVPKAEPSDAPSQCS